MEQNFPARLVVAVAAEDPLARSAVAQRLRDAPGALLVRERLSPEAVEEPGADVVVLDVGMMPKDGMELVRTLSQHPTPLVALISHESLAPEAMAQGASALLFRNASAEMLGAAVQAVSEGLTVLDPSLTSTLLRPVEPELPDEPREELTPREREVLSLLAQGLSNRDIAHRLDISEHTAKFHVNAILSKLGVQRRVEAVVRAARLGMVTL